MTDTLRDKMYLELKSKAIFSLAKNYALEYVEGAFDRRVYPTENAINDLKVFAEDLCEEPGNAESLLEKLNKHGTPATVSLTGGRYFGFVVGGVLPVCLSVRWLTDVWDQNGALYVLSPLLAKLEETCEVWLRQILGLPETVVAGFVSGTSAAIFCALAAARYRIWENVGWNVNEKGVCGAPTLRIVAGREIHGTVVKAIALLGLGTDRIEWVETDNQGRIMQNQIPKLDENTILILQAGNVNSGSFDNFEDICTIANKAGAWVHIDGAFGLWAAGSRRLSHLTKGIEKANSWSVDAHKTLNTPYDSGILLCNDKVALVHALQASGSYIAYSDRRDGMLYTPEMSRRSRAIELWAALKYLGIKGLDELVFGFHQRAIQMAHELGREGFQILNNVVFNQVLVCCNSDEMTAHTMKHIQASGECWVGGAAWKGRRVIRVSICSWATLEGDITRSVNAFVLARAAAEKDLKRC